VLVILAFCVGAQAGAVAGDGPFDVAGEVVPQVPAISDLDRGWCALAGSVGWPSLLAVRAAARPASARPMASSIRRAGGLRRAYGVVSLGTCSAKVRTGQPGWWQKNRRTRSRTSTGWPPVAASARVRS
jgi:hypothetical protein